MNLCDTPFERLALDRYEFNGDELLVGQCHCGAMVDATDWDEESPISCPECEQIWVEVDMPDEDQEENGDSYFLTALDATLGHEGKYAKDLDDPGGETIFGISRHFHPDWLGWATVDALKGDVDFPLFDWWAYLGPLVTDFYRTHYWNRLRGDAIAEISLEVAEELFDTAVNMGVTTASSYLQRSLNYLNYDQKIYPDLLVDGLIGPKTLRNLEHIISRGEERLLMKFLNILQGYHYMESMRKSPVKEKYARGWFKRVAIGRA